MPILWIYDDAGGWGSQTLAQECCLTPAIGNGVQLTHPEGQLAPGALRFLPPQSAGPSRSWTLLAGPEVFPRINGHALAMGIRALRDRDEITFVGHRCYFSTEELAQIGPFPGLPQPACCPRCKRKLEIGALSVMCPHCNAWHHQSEEFPCWTYDATCALCQLQSTALDAGYSWTPETL